MRFKCASKLWFSLILSRYFSNLRLTVAPPTQPPRLYMSLMEHLIACDSMEVCHNPGKTILVSLTSSSNNGSEAFDQDLTMTGLGGQDMVVLRGLILYKVCRKACIYNPTTRQSLTLPAVKSNIFGHEEPRKYVYYFFGHDHVLDQYKVVCNVMICLEDFEIVTSEHWVFVLEVGGSWKRIKFDHDHHMPTRLGLCINGVIYYLADTRILEDIVVSFDVRSEEFSMIQSPDVVSQTKYVGFIEYCGKTAIFYYTLLREDGSVNLWVLEDGGKWSKKSLVLQLCQMHLVNNDIELKLEGTTRNGEVILVPNPFHSPYYILYYDMQKNDLRKVDIIREISDHGSLKTYNNLAVMDKSESITHLET